MPNCFQLFRIGSESKEPESLNQIDRELCQVLGLEEHPTIYVGCWFDMIGRDIAMGGTFETIRDDYMVMRAEKPDDEHNVRFYDDLLKMLDYLEKNFTPNSWAEIGKRN